MLRLILSCLLLRRILHSLFLAGHKKEKQKALSPAVVLENLRHTLVDYQNRCSNASVEVRVELTVWKICNLCSF